MDIELARKVIDRLSAVRDKIELLPAYIQYDLILECKLLEDRIRDKFFRSRR
jgi:hypothetical protein